MLILISACLGGVNCKYNGKNNLKPCFASMHENSKVILVCPEELGGLTTPRPPCEIVGGDGADVLSGTARVLNRNGTDVTNNFIQGARQTLLLARQNNIKQAILKSRSPSCGTSRIYNGTFSGKLMTGDGVTAALLKAHGIKVISDTEYLSQKGV